MPSDWRGRSAAPEVCLRVLGGVSLEVVREGDVPREPGLRLRRLLAILASRAGSVVSVEAAAHALWGADQPAAPRAALHTLVSRLRVALRATTAATEESSPTVLARESGYVLDIDPSALDASRFEQLARAGRALLHEDPAAAVDSLSEALDLWRGQAYAEFVDEDFAKAEASRLLGVHDAAVEDCAEALLALGRHNDAVPLLGRLVAREPLRERALGRLMAARYRRGRRADSLDPLQAFQGLLDADRSPGRRKRQGDIPRQQARRDRARVPRQRRGPDEDGRAPAPHDQPKPQSDHDVAGAGNLPATPPVLIGRAADLEALAREVRPGAVVTLTGPGGVGKTSLALRVGSETGDRFPDGVRFCDLASLTSDDDVALAVMSSLDLQSASGADPDVHLLGHLRTRRQLLILDGCEQVLGAAAELTHEVHRHCREVGVLLTSGSPLEIADECVWPVQPLSVPLPGDGAADLATVAAAPAAQLFVARTRRCAESFELTEGNADAVAEICRRLDGLPLAIELVTAGMGATTPAVLANPLPWPFAQLDDAPGAGPDRRTLQTVVDWSFALLDEDHRRVFEVLSLFASGFDLGDAERLVGAVPELAASHADAAVVRGLVDSSLISVSPDGRRRRYAILDTLRAHGRQQLEGRPWACPARLAHARMVADVTSDAAGRLYGPGHVSASKEISAYLDELRAAHSWALANDLGLAARLVASLMLYVEHRMPVEVQQWAERTLRAVPADHSPVGLAGVYAVAAAGARFTGDLRHATELAERGLQLAPDPVTAAYLHVLLGQVALSEGRLDDAERRLGEVAVLAGTSDLGAVLLLSELVEPLVAAHRGDGESASRVAERIEARAAGLGAGPIEARARYLRAEALLDSDPEKAAVLLDAAIELARAQGDRYAMEVAMVSAASLRGHHGDPHGAVQLFRDVIDHWSSVDDWTHQWRSLCGVVDVLLRLGRDKDAAVLRGGLVDRALAAPIDGPGDERMATAETLLRRRLGDDLFSELTRHGARMSDDVLVAFARKALVPGDGPAQRRR